MWVSGHLVEVVSGAPVRQAIVQAGTGGTLTDSTGWFRLFLGPDLPPEIQLESLGCTTVLLRFSPAETERVFFFQCLSGSCEVVIAVGVESRPRRVALLPRDLGTGLPAVGSGSVMVRRYGNADSTVVSVEVTESDLALPISEAGVYSVVLNLQGYEAWRRELLVVPKTECGMSDVDEDVWLVPNRVR